MSTDDSSPVEQAKPQESSESSGSSRDDKPRDTVFIGKKPLMAYVTTTLLQLAEISTVNIRARGMSISRAVDVAQIISRKRENTGYTIGEIQLGSESLESNDGKQRNVSTINIVVSQN